MARTQTNWRALLTVLLLAVASPVAAGCDPRDDDPKPNCVLKNPQSRGQLPKIDADNYAATIDPCLKALDLAGYVTDLIPVLDRIRPGYFSYKKALGRMATALTAAKDTVQCGYERDRLSIGIYQHKNDKWAVGVVAVIRGRVGAAADVLICLALRQIPFDFSSGSQNCVLGVCANDASSTPDVCFSSLVRRRGGQDYTMLWAGSSQELCSDFEKLRSKTDDLPVAWVAAEHLVIRSGPSTSYEKRGQIDRDQSVTVECYVTTKTLIDGPNELRSPEWARVTVNGTSGYVADVWLTPQRVPGTRNC